VAWGGDKDLERETEKVGAQDQHRQGDIFLIEYPNGAAAGPSLGLVINADCDLANKKTDGVIAYLPIYSFREYLDGFWARTYLNDVAHVAAQKVLEIVQADDAEAEELQEWLLSTSAETVMAKITKLEHVKKSHHAQLEDHLRRMRTCADQDRSPLERFGALCQLEKNPALAVKKQIVAAKKAMGDGHFFISDLVGHAEVGFVIRMRRIYTIPEAFYFTSVASQRSLSDGRSITAARFARLTPLYQFKVAQLFAQQYSRIGLPDEITALSDVAIEVLASHISQVG
jgi:hypothetical protein